MEPLLSALQALPEYRTLTAAAEGGEHVAITGLAQICRSHWIAAFHRLTGRPVVVLCQDDMAVQRTMQLRPDLLD